MATKGYCKLCRHPDINKRRVLWDQNATPRYHLAKEWNISIQTAYKCMGEHRANKAPDQLAAEATVEIVPDQVLTVGPPRENLPLSYNLPPQYTRTQGEDAFRIGLSRLTEAADSLLEQANNIKDAEKRAKLLKAAQGPYELLGKHLGLVTPTQNVQVNVLTFMQSDRWKALRDGLAKVLAPYPEAALAVAEFFEAQEPPHAAST